MAVSIDATREGQAVRLEVVGEVDVSNASELRDALEAELAGEVEAVEVDISQVPYIDSTGIGVLVAAAHEAIEAGVAFAVRNPQKNVARVLTMLDVAERLGVTESEPAAGVASAA